MKAKGKPRSSEHEDEDDNDNELDNNNDMSDENIGEIKADASAEDIYSSNQVFKGGEASWARPPVPATLTPGSSPLIFQQLEIDSYLGDHLPGMPGSTIKPVPIIRMYGVTKDGNSVMCHVHGFHPYIYIPAPANFTEAHCLSFQRALNSATLNHASHLAKDGLADVILAVEICTRETVMGYHGNRKVKFLKITIALPKHVTATRKTLESGITVAPFGYIASSVYEANIDYVLRFMIDTKLKGCSWVEIPVDKWSLRTSANSSSGSGSGHISSGNKPTLTATTLFPSTYTTAPSRVSLCQLEVDVAWDSFIAHSPEGDWSTIAPIRILSFDIECAGRKGVFPDPNFDPVIQIASMVVIQGETKPIIRNVFTLKSCASIVGSEVISRDKEGDMLESWARFFLLADADIVTGYNIINFDLPYLINRAKHLRVKSFPYLGRIRGVESTIKNSTFSSKAYGSRENKVILMDGRCQFDVLQILQRDFKLRSYTLNSVSAHFLGEQKEDVHYSIISDLQNGNDQTRRRLAVYCLKDAYLPLRLLAKLMCVVNYMEMARVTGVPFNYLLARGQQIKVVSQLFRKAREQDLVIPTIDSHGAGEETYEGATVIEPSRGYYDVPIATLDFASLYPSIMMAHNLCYTTLVNDPSKLPPDSYIRTPSGDVFVKKSLRKGLLPEILEELLDARKKAKNDLKKETDPFKKAVLDGRQLALKVKSAKIYFFKKKKYEKIKI